MKKNLILINAILKSQKTFKRIHSNQTKTEWRYRHMCVCLGIIIGDCKYKQSNKNGFSFNFSVTESKRDSVQFINELQFNVR